VVGRRIYLYTLFYASSSGIFFFHVYFLPKKKKVNDGRMSFWILDGRWEFSILMNDWQAGGCTRVEVSSGKMKVTYMAVAHRYLVRLFLTNFVGLICL
jgi:hypothetical protein